MSLGVEVSAGKVLEGSRYHVDARKAFEESEEEQLRRLSACIQESVRLTTRVRDQEPIVFASRMPTAQGAEQHDWDSVNCPYLNGEVTFECTVKDAGIENGRSYFIVFVRQTVRLLYANLFLGREYRVWLKDLSGFELLETDG